MRADRFGAAPLPVPHQDPATSRAKAQAILSQHQFQHPDSLLTRAVRWIADRIGSLFGALFAGGAGAAVAWVVVGLFGLAIVAVVLLVVRRSAPPRSAGPPEEPLRIEVRRGAQDWTAEAERLEAAGDWKAALRCRYRALTSALVADHLVRDLPGRTSGEYRDDLSDTVPDARADFGAASDLFERAWYGDRPTGEDESRRFRDHASAVVTRAGRARERVGS